MVGKNALSRQSFEALEQCLIDRVSKLTLSGVRKASNYTVRRVLLLAIAPEKNLKSKFSQEKNGTAIAMTTWKRGEC